MTELTYLLQVTFFSRVNLNWLESIKRGLFNSVPVINQENVQTYLEKPVHTAMGHRD